MVSCEKAKVHWEIVVGISKRVAINGNGFGIDFKTKNFKV
jgi:hypothetical protein